MIYAWVQVRRISWTYPGANWEEAISPGLSPAAAAIAAKLALLGNWAAPCRAADNPGAATITWPVPTVVAIEVEAGVTLVCAFVTALLSAILAWLMVGDGLKDGELFAVVTIDAVEITDAVFVGPTVAPGVESVEKTTAMV